MKKYPFGSLTVTVGAPGRLGFYAYINRVGKTRTFYDPPLTLRRRLLRAISGEPVFGSQVEQHPVSNYPNSTAWYLDNFERQK